MAVVSHIGAVLPPDGVLSAFVLYWLKTVDFGTIAHATTLPSLPLTKVRNIPFRLPPLAEQRRIVEEIEKQFTRLDAAVKALRAAQARLKRLPRKRAQRRRYRQARADGSRARPRRGP